MTRERMEHTRIRWRLCIHGATRAVATTMLHVGGRERGNIIVSKLSHLHVRDRVDEAPTDKRRDHTSERRANVHCGRGGFDA